MKKSCIAMLLAGGQGSRNLVFITLGTGVGGGVIVNGKVIDGTHGAGGEIGHITVDRHETAACGWRTVSPDEAREVIQVIAMDTVMIFTTYGEKSTHADYLSEDEARRLEALLSRIASNTSS